MKWFGPSVRAAVYTASLHGDINILMGGLKTPLFTKPYEEP